MYSNQTLFVIVRNPNPFERYFLDFQTGQAALTPDVASSIVQGLLPSLQKVGEIHGFDFMIAAKTTTDKCADQKITDTDIPDAVDVLDVVQPVGECIAQIAFNAIAIYQELEPYAAPDAHLPTSGLAATKTLDQIAADIVPLIRSEIAVSSRISAISDDPGLKATADMDDRAAAARAVLEMTGPAFAKTFAGHGHDIFLIQEARRESFARQAGTADIDHDEDAAFWHACDDPRRIGEP